MTLLTILNNKKCNIQIDEDNFKKLRKLLSYKVQGAEYNFAFQNGNWNGINYLITNKGTFNIGLLTRVENYLKENNIEYKVEDKRKPIVKNEPLDISENLKKHGLVPREHQIRILDVVEKNERGIIRSCTGSGKTTSIAMCAASLGGTNGKVIVWIVGLDILDQFYQLFCKLFDEEIGYIGNGVCNIKRINLVSVWTAGKVLKLDKKNLLLDEINEEDKNINEEQQRKIYQLIKTTKIHFFDESQYCSTNTVITLFKAIDNPERIFGFSGTPFRGHNNDIVYHSILGEQIIDISASELIEKSYLCAPIIKFYTVPKPKGYSSSNYQTIYKECIVENEDRNNLIIKCTKELLEKKYIPLLLFKQINHGEILIEKLEDAGIKCAILSGKDNIERRNELKDKLIKREIDVLCASIIFETGVDIPELSALVICGSGKALVGVSQKIGRILRISKNKKYAAVVDFYDQVKYLKNHSIERYNIYKSEKGFKVIPSKEMKK